MLRITVKYSELQKYLAIASQVSPKKNDLEIITFTKIDVLENSLKLESSNITFATISHIPLEGVLTGEKFSFLIKTDLFFDCITSFSGEMVDLLVDLESHQITIKVNLSKAKLRINTDLVKDWRELKPAEASLHKTDLSIAGADFNHLSKLALIAVGQPKVVLQPEFLNICLNVDPVNQKLAIVSSDRFRLSLNTNPLVLLEKDGISKLTEATNFIIPTKVISLVSRVLPDTSSLEISLNTDDAWFKFDNIVIYTQFVDGKYPDYDKIVPQSFSCSLQVDKGEFLKAIKQVYFLSRNQFNKDITFSVSPAEKTITITSKSDILGESENQISILEIDGNQDEWQQSFNANYFLDYLALIDDSVVTWDANPGKPSVLYGKDNKAKGLYLVCGLNR